MAQVDFSNARIEPLHAITWSWDYQLGLASTGALFSSDGTQIVSNQQMNYSYYNPPTKAVILYAGAFTASGTEFYIKNQVYGWKVSNVSFSAGDSYSFEIEITNSGS